MPPYDIQIWYGSEDEVQFICRSRPPYASWLMASFLRPLPRSVFVSNSLFHTRSPRYSPPNPRSPRRPSALNRTVSRVPSPPPQAVTSPPPRPFPARPWSTPTPSLPRERKVRYARTPSRHKKGPFPLSNNGLRESPPIGEATSTVTCGLRSLDHSRLPQVSPPPSSQIRSYRNSRRRWRLVTRA